MPQHVVAYSGSPPEAKKPRKSPQSEAKVTRQRSDSVENVTRGSRHRDEKGKQTERRDKKRSRDKEVDTFREEKAKREVKELRLPTFVLAASKLHPKLVAEFREEYQSSADIHSLSPSLDGETFLTASDLRLNLWDLQHPESPLSVLDFSCSSFYIADLTGK